MRCPENQGVDGVSPCLRLKTQGSGAPTSKAEHGYCRSSKASEFSLLPPFPSIQVLNRLDDAHFHWRAIFFVQSTDSNDNLFLRHPHRHNQI